MAFSAIFVTFSKNNLYLTIPTNPKSIIFTLNDKNIMMVMHEIAAKVIIVFLLSGNGFIFLEACVCQTMFVFSFTKPITVGAHGNCPGAQTGREGFTK